MIDASIYRNPENLRRIQVQNLKTRLCFSNYIWRVDANHIKEDNGVGRKMKHKGQVPNA